MSTEISGVLIMIDQEKAITPTFKKREFVVQTEEQYPQKILMQFTNDKCDLLNTKRVGDKVVVGVNIQGRDWVNPQGEVKYFNTLQAWKINDLQPTGNYNNQTGYNQSGSAVNDYMNNRNNHGGYGQNQQGYPKGQPQQGYSNQNFNQQQAGGFPPQPNFNGPDEDDLHF